MKRTKTCYKILSLLLCLAMLLPLSGCGEGKMSQSEIFAMDTQMTLTAYGKNRDAGIAAAESISRSMDSMLDPELETSLVYAMNNANGSGVAVSGQIANMISTAQTVYRQSGGALDLTVYPLVKLWGFIDGKYYVPTDEEISACLQKLCFDQVVLTSFPSSGTYSVSMPSYGQISFGAVAKGCAASYAIEAMRNAGVESGIVSLGGNVQTLGVKPDGSLWTVAVTDPNNTASYLGLVKVGEAAVVTSGSYQRNFTSLEGKFYHHLLKPSTGYPVTNTLQSVTIICDDGTMADCLSTAMFILGETQALNYWRTYGGFDMILITNDNRIVCTSGLIEQFTLSNENYTVTFTE